jgi:hypothetical protein
MRFIARALGVIVALHIAAGARTVVAQASPAPAGKDSQMSGLHACSLLTDADITRIKGTPNQLNIPPERSEMPNGATMCNFVGLDLTLTPRVTKPNFESNRQSAGQERNTTTEPASGVGEEAYFYVKSRPTSSNVGIVFRVGSYQVALGDRVRSDSVAWFKPRLVELAKVAAAKLR